MNLNINHSRSKSRIAPVDRPSNHFNWRYHKLFIAFISGVLAFGLVRYGISILITVFGFAVLTFAFTVCLYTHLFESRYSDSRLCYRLGSVVQPYVMWFMDGRYTERRSLRNARWAVLAPAIVLLASVLLV